MWWYCLERVKQSSVSSSIIIKVNTDFLEKVKNVPQKHPVSLPAIISFCFSTEMLTFFYASKSVCLFVRLFVWHLPVFLAISIFISFEFVTYSLYLSVITYHFLFDFIHPSIGAEFKTLSPSRMVYTYPSAVWVSLLN